jgi:hypothetical protein
LATKLAAVSPLFGGLMTTMFSMIEAAFPPFWNVRAEAK